MAIEHIGVKDADGATQDVAVDTVGTDQYQVVKLGLGADGALDNLVDAGVQAAAASIPVTRSTEDAAVVTNLTNIAADDAAIKAAVVGVMV